MPAPPRERVELLMRLALDSGANHDEARNAAMAAIRLIHNHNLLGSVDTPSLEDFFNRAQASTPEPEPQEVPEKPRKKSKKEVPSRSRTELRELAEEKVKRYVSFLLKKSIIGEYPCSSAKALTAKAVENKEISDWDRSVFNYYLQQELGKKVLSGVLCSRGGYKGGYFLYREKIS